MPARKSALAQLDLDDLETRLYSKYEITRADAHLAGQYLRCFFDAKRHRPNELIILPQIADWAWHELILDTVRYRAVCEQAFGVFLHHIKEPLHPDEIPEDPLGTQRQEPEVLREHFLRSMELMRDVYGLGLGERSDQWLEAGWDKPLYRLRLPIEFPESNIEGGSECQPDTIYAEGELSRLSWLPARISCRFGIPFDSALRGVWEYTNLFLGCGRKQILYSQKSVLCEIAWEEHVLWTSRYDEDCRRVLGHFLDHPVRKEPSCL